MAYESPINLFFYKDSSDFIRLCDQINKEREDAIIATIREQYMISVDREELTKALKYDRDQYKKGYEEGYQDGYQAMINERTDPAEWIETDHKGTPYLCPKCQCFSNLRYYWCPWCGKDMRPEPIRNADNTEDEEET